ncbi:unnamed protein product [Orchesella dallaii]|uniref:Uncharacterized protein n=1 Tax=Orchesella dallaii TaxID=48710 RepID=A0ABP1RYY5_9HEXA
MMYHRIIDLMLLNQHFTTTLNNSSTALQQLPHHFTIHPSASKKRHINNNNKKASSHHTSQTHFSPDMDCITFWHSFIHQLTRHQSDTVSETETHYTCVWSC